MWKGGLIYWDFDSLQKSLVRKQICHFSELKYREVIGDEGLKDESDKIKAPFYLSKWPYEYHYPGSISLCTSRKTQQLKWGA